MLQIEGRNPVVEGLESSKVRYQKVILQTGMPTDSKIDKILKYCSEQNIKVERQPKSFLDKLSETGVHQGVIGIALEMKYLKISDLLQTIRKSNRDPFLLIVRESMYEHNLGALLRTASCAGVNGVIITKRSEITPNVIRTSMGATNHLDICQSDIFSAIKEIKDADIRLVGIELHESSKWYYEAPLNGGIALIIGGEDHPLSAEIINKCDFCVKIPLLSNINSLNMSVAAGIVMYEKLRQELI